MTRRERMERRLERREEWAKKARGRSESAAAGVRSIADHIPFGQPILVGHHSEKRARKDADRIHRGMERSVNEARLADHHERKASGIRSRLESTIFSEDEDAIERLQERIAELEAERERRKLVNRLYTKGDVKGLAALGLTLESLRTGMPHYETRPYPPYSLQNIGANIRRLKKRLADLGGAQ